MQTKEKELFAVKFADAMARLKKLGLEGEVAVSAGVVMVATDCKNSASCFRKAIKTACKNTGAIYTENRPNATKRVFTIVI